MTQNYMSNVTENVIKTLKPGELVLPAGHSGSGMTAVTAEMAAYIEV